MNSPACYVHFITFRGWCVNSSSRLTRFSREEQRPFRGYCDSVECSFSVIQYKGCQCQSNAGFSSSPLSLSTLIGAELTPFLLHLTFFVRCLILCTPSFFSLSLCASSQLGRFREAASQAKVVPRALHRWPCRLLPQLTL